MKLQTLIFASTFILSTAVPVPSRPTPDNSKRDALFIFGGLSWLGNAINAPPASNAPPPNYEGLVQPTISSCKDPAPTINPKYFWAASGDDGGCRDPTPTPKYPWFPAEPAGGSK